MENKILEKYKKNQKNELKYCLLSTNLVYHTKNDLSIFFLKKYKKISYFFPLDCFSQIIIFSLGLFFSFFIDYLCFLWGVFVFLYSYFIYRLFFRFMPIKYFLYYKALTNYSKQLGQIIQR